MSLNFSIATLAGCTWLLATMATTLLGQTPPSVITHPLDWSQFGVLGVILGAIFYGAFYASRKLFANDGILWALANRHIAFVDAARSSLECYATNQKNCILMQTKIAEEVHAFCERYGDPEAYKTEPLEHAVVITCDVLRKIAKQSNVDIETELSAIQHVLRQR